MAASTEGWHETLHAESRRLPPSNRVFGFTLSSLLAILGIWALWEGSRAGAWELGGAAAFLIVTLVSPGLLAPLNRIWTLFGVLLQKIASPVAMAILFYGTVTPIGVLLRIFRRDPLRRRIDPAASTYWIARPPASAQKTTMKNQF